MGKKGILVTGGSGLVGANAVRMLLERGEQLEDRRRSFQRDQFPQDLVGTVIFLSSDDSDFITGQTINMDGAQNMY